MDLENILNTIQPFVVLFVALFVAFMTATWVASVIWSFRDIRSRTRDIFAQVLATLMVLVFFPLFPLPGLLLYFILRPRETLAEIYERKLEEEALLQGIEERLACPGCNRRIEDDFVVCPSCHTRLKKGCPSCGRFLHLRWNICPYCGAPQAAPPPVILAPEEEEAPRLVGRAASSLPQPGERSRIGAGETSEDEESGALGGHVGDELDRIAGGEPDGTAGDEPEGTASDEPEGTASNEPDGAASDEPDAAASDEPDGITGDEPEGPGEDDAEFETERLALEPD